MNDKYQKLLDVLIEQTNPPTRDIQCVMDTCSALRTARLCLQQMGEYDMANRIETIQLELKK